MSYWVRYRFINTSVLRRIAVPCIAAVAMWLTAYSRVSPSTTQKSAALEIAATLPPAVQAHADTPQVHIPPQALQHFVAPHPPQTYWMRIEPSPHEAPTGYPIRFEIRRNFPSGNPAYHFSVEFGDGSSVPLPADAAITQHVYAHAGTFKVVARLVYFSAAANAEAPRYGDSTSLKIDSVSLTATPEVAHPGEEVTFSVHVDMPLADLRYRFSFGDVASFPSWSPSPVARHRYAQANAYSAFADVGRSVHGSVVPFTKTQIQQITILPPPTVPPQQVLLSVDKQRVILGNPVYFSASTIPAAQSVVYRFDFGDGSTSQWQEAGATSHQYPRTGRFKVYAFASYGQGVLQSNPLLVQVDSFVRPMPGNRNGRPPWAWIIAGVAAVAAAVVAIRPVRQAIFRPRVTFKIKRGTEVPRARAAAPPRIAARVILRPNLRKGRFTTDAHGATIIKSIRRRHA